jgi:hypothetical protein
MRHVPSRLSLLARAAMVAGLLGASSLAQALDIKPFSAQALAAAQKAGQPAWKCTATALEQLKSDKSLDAVTVLVADYDAERDLRRTMKVRSQSTLVVFKGAEERARLAGEGDGTALAAALRKAL